ncbi:hypothetical protein D9X91_21270 [Falsibacillus albus]|uniref:Uncharacterized protein n=1 Tax=Falsibacillus albus TaxID=2478915 RepID=A0A3L7JRB8_9BACI|nr:hypothetical protein D9X91_21270 [Falsibacillus albus]
MLIKTAFLISFFMALYLFSYSFIEGLKLGDKYGKPNIVTFLFSFIMAFVFSGMTYLFIE